MRQLLELMLLRHGDRTRTAVRCGAAVDAVHALTMRALAARYRRERRALLVNAAVAAAFAADAMLAPPRGRGPT